MFFFILKFPEQTPAFSQHSHTVEIDRTNCRIFRMQTMISFFLIERFDSRCSLICHRYDDIAVMCDVLFAYDDAVPVKDTGIDHTVPGYIEQEYFTIMVRCEMFR